MPITHDDLLGLMDIIGRPDDYVPYGENRDREGDERSDPEAYRGDCSCGCKWFVPLGGAVGNDWGVCVNRASYRCGLLTFEHQGCRYFEEDPDLRAE